MILNSLDSFINKPIVFNNKQSLKDYTNDEIITKFNEEYCIGIINSIEYINNEVIGNVTYFEDIYNKNKFDNWQIQLNEDNKSFIYCACEIFE